MTTVHIGKPHVSRLHYESGYRTHHVRAALRAMAVVVLTVVTLAVILSGFEGVSPIGVAGAAGMGGLLVAVLHWGLFPTQPRH